MYATFSPVPRFGEVAVCHLFSGFQYGEFGCVPSFRRLEIIRPAHPFSGCRPRVCNSPSIALSWNRKLPRGGGRKLRELAPLSTSPSWLGSIVYDGWQRHPHFLSGVRVDSENAANRVFAIFRPLYATVLVWGR